MTYIYLKALFRASCWKFFFSFFFFLLRIKNFQGSLRFLKKSALASRFFVVAIIKHENRWVGPVSKALCCVYLWMKLNMPMTAILLILNTIKRLNSNERKRAGKLEENMSNTSSFSCHLSCLSSFLFFGIPSSRSFLCCAIFHSLLLLFLLFCFFSLLLLYVPTYLYSAEWRMNEWHNHRK